MPKYVVRYGTMRHLGLFSCRARDRYARGQRIIARTGRGQELGEVLCEATDHVVAQMGEKPHTGQILRLRTSEDEIELRRLGEQEQSEFDTCQEQITRLGLDMKLVDVERLYGGERVVVYYLAEQRVDFRELVKTLAKELQTRVEMRQIGVRDEAKLLADYGDCGKPVCCNTHLSEMPPVSMRMAKLQKATLDPTKISGRCGRLKCCLRYEYDTYQELKRELPRVGAQVVTRDGQAKVLSQEILTGELLVSMEDGRRVAISAKDVLSVLPGGGEGKNKSDGGGKKKKGPDKAKEHAEGAPRRKGKPPKGEASTPGEDPPAPPTNGESAKERPAPPSADDDAPGSPGPQE